MEQKIPIKEGEDHNARVEGFGAKGDAMFKIQGFVVFAPVPPNTSVTIGDIAHVRITRILSSVGFAAILDVTKVRDNV